MTVVSGLNMEYVCVYLGVICIAPCFYTAANFSNSCETIFFFLSLKLFFFLFLPTWGSYLITLLLLLLSRFSHVRLCVTPETAAHQAPPSLGFSRQKHWNGLPFPSPMHENENYIVIYYLIMTIIMKCIFKSIYRAYTMCRHCARLF